MTESPGFFLLGTSASGAAAIREKAARAGAAVFYPAIGDWLNWTNGVTVHVLNNCVTAASTPNNCSLVLRVATAKSSMLFQGDAELDSIARMLASFKGELGSDVLKVGHHGSKNATTDDWIAAVHPSKGYIEVGARNSYGHPTQQALGILSSHGVEIHRTDLEGTMELDLP